MSTRYTAFPDYGANYGAGQEPQWSDPSWEYIDPVTGDGGGDLHPWKVSIEANQTFPETGDPIAVITIKGNIVDQILGVTELELTDWSDEDGFSEDITGTGVVCLKYTYGSDGPPVVDPVITLEFKLDDDYKAFELDEEDPPNIIASRYPLALIIDNPDLPDDPTPADLYVVVQLCRNHLAKTIICSNGRSLTSFTPI